MKSVIVKVEWTRHNSFTIQSTLINVRTGTVGELQRILSSRRILPFLDWTKVQLLIANTYQTVTKDEDLRTLSAGQLLILQYDSVAYEEKETKWLLQIIMLIIFAGTLTNGMTWLLLIPLLLSSDFDRTDTLYINT